MKRLQLVVEVLGVTLYLAAHFALAWVYILGASLQGVPQIPYWAVIGAGYLAMLVVAFVRPAHMKKVPPRRSFDTWLWTAVPALAVCAIAVNGRWPIELPGWSGHGLGAEGGEANAALFPWLHGILWVLFLRRP